MSSTSRILWLAAVAGVLGLAAGFMVSGGGRQLAMRALATDAGQLAVARAAPPATGVATPALLGSPRPTLVLPDLEGRSRNLDEFASRPMLINFLASWCEPCRRELPELDRYGKSQTRRGVQVIGVAVEELADARLLLDQVPVDFPVLIAGNAGIALMPQFGNVSGTLPYSVLIGADGRLRARRIGTLAPGSTEAWVEDALAQEP